MASDDTKKDISISELRKEVRNLREKLEKCQERNHNLEIQTDAIRSVLKIYQNWGRRPT